MVDGNRGPERLRRIGPVHERRRARRAGPGDLDRSLDPEGTGRKDRHASMSNACLVSPRGMRSVRPAAVLVVLVFALGPFADVPAGPHTKPNIVVIMTDDQTVEQLRVMSATRSIIGDAGARFANSFSSFPLCCPSRATFFTGQYAHNHGVLENEEP